MPFRRHNSTIRKTRERRLVSLERSCRALGRAVVRRVFIASSGRMYWVRGQVGFYRLLYRLARRRTPPAWDDAPWPAELGFPPGEISEITGEDLALFSGKLAQCRRSLRFEIRRSGRTCYRLRTCKELCDTVSQRLGAIREWRKQLAIGEPVPGAPFAIPQGELDKIQTIIAEALAARRLPATWEWMVRFAAWAAGTKALQRCLASLVPFLPTAEEQEEVLAVARLQRLLGSWRRGGKRAVPPSEGHEFSPRTLAARLKAALAELPDSLRQRGELPPLRRARDAAKHCRELLRRCGKFLKDRSNVLSTSLAAGVTALCVCDGAQTPLPAQVLRLRRFRSPRNRGRPRPEPAALFVRLFRLSKMRGYDDFLKTAGQMRQAIYFDDLGHFRRFSANGASSEDLDWLLDRGIAGELALGHSPQPLREFTDVLSSLGAPPTSDELSQWCMAMSGREDAVLLRAFSSWLRHAPLRRLTPRGAQQVKQTLAGLLGRTGVARRCLAFLGQWQRPSRRSSGSPRRRLDLPEGVPPDLRRCLRQIGSFRRLAGRSPVLPRSVRKAEPGKETKEIEYLRSKAAGGQATPRMMQRLRLLEHRQSNGPRLNVDKLWRDAGELYVVAGLEAVRRQFQRQAASWWHDFLGRSPDECLPGKIAARRQIEICNWVEDLDADERLVARRLLDAWRRHGRDYKRRLPENQIWLAKAARAGVDTTAWLDPCLESTCNLGERTAVIGLARHPVDVFLMGSHFDTCLNLADGCNRDSVLANAYHANKAVLYARDGRGAVLARKLIAVSSSFRLLGYYDYLHLPKESDDREALVTAIHDHCHRLAGAARLRLDDEGEPEYLGGHFWWDDDPVPWRNSAGGA